MTADKVNGISFSIKGQAKNPPIVLIHGFPFDRTMWSGQIVPLSKDHRVIFYDVRGHGQSEIGDGKYSIDLFAEDLIRLLDHLEIRQAVVCGLSMGGYIGLRAAERHPDRFSALILCDTKSTADTDETKKKRAAAAEAVKKNGVLGFAEEFVKGVLTVQTLQTKPQIVETVKNMILRNSAVGVAGTLGALAGRTDTTPALSKITAPVLILTGSEDKLTPPADAQAMARLFPNAQIHFIPDAAHLSNLENPSVFNEKILTFLKTLSRTAANGLAGFNARQEVK